MLMFEFSATSIKISDQKPQKIIPFFCRISKSVSGSHHFSKIVSYICKIRRFNSEAEPINKGNEIINPENNPRGVAEVDS